MSKLEVDNNDSNNFFRVHKLSKLDLRKNKSAEDLRATPTFTRA